VTFYNLSDYKKMNNFIPHDVFLKIKEAQNNTMNKVIGDVSFEISYISKKFVEELKNNLEVLLSDPFNIYIKIPRICTDNSKLYLAELRKQYIIMFGHELQLGGSAQTGDTCFYVLLKHDKLVCNGDPRPQQLMLEVEKPVEADPNFTDSEKKKFEAEIAAELPYKEASAVTSKRPSIRSGFSGEKKEILVPLFLQRRNSRLSLPTISARRQVEVSVSDNQEESET
jgi:hypothetical protein